MVGTGGPGRTFEQLLAQQLGDQDVVGQNLQGNDNTPDQKDGDGEAPRAKAPRPFLRRGQGLTRFNLPGASHEHFSFLIILEYLYISHEPLSFHPSCSIFPFM